MHSKAIKFRIFGKNNQQRARALIDAKIKCLPFPDDIYKARIQFLQTLTRHHQPDKAARKGDKTPIS